MIFFTVLGVIFFIYLLVGVGHLIWLVTSNGFSWYELKDDPYLAGMVIMLWPLEHIE